MATSPASNNLLPAAALVSLLVLLLGAVGLFSLSSTGGQTARALERVSAFHAAQVSAVEAQVSFKTQVQEWKNILLRGQNDADRQTYQARFETRESEVQTGLAQFKQQLAQLGRDEAPVTAVIAAHAALGVAYRQALAQHPPGNPGASAAIDAAVRGIDRKLNDDIDALARTVEAAARDEIVQFQTAAASRYAVLRKVTLACAGLTVVAAFWLVFAASRARVRQPAR